MPPPQKYTYFGKKWVLEESMQVAKLVEECVEQGLDGQDAVTSVGLLLSAEATQFARFLYKFNHRCKLDHFTPEQRLEFVNKMQRAVVGLVLLMLKNEQFHHADLFREFAYFLEPRN